MTRIPQNSMQWISTRGAAAPATFCEALFEGLAPDGGLYVPERLDPIPSHEREALRGCPLAGVGTAIAAHLIGSEVPRDALSRLVADALDFDIPLVPVGLFRALELFHGPTLAFKDVGARVMARLMAHFVAADGADAGARDRRPATVLVATSGDTGGAVAQAFAGVPGTRVVVLYPDGQVSDVQEAQFATIGGNVSAVAVKGTFDDCQALVKAAFSTPSLRESVRLTSANSINVGRLLPQVFYYAWGSLQVPDAIWSVPSGNFGNLTAGLIARRLGFPIARFVAATNVNDIVPKYLASGVYAPRPSQRTVANAMDVGAPSNFERMRALFGDDARRMRAEISGAAFTDEQVRVAIGSVHRRHGYVLDPHSAIAWLGLESFATVDRPGIFVATAHPAKFRETVEPVIGRPLELPAALRDALARRRTVTRIPADLAALVKLLR